MLGKWFIPILLAVVLAAPAQAEDASPFGQTVVAPKDSLLLYLTYVDREPLFDTLVVITDGKPDRRIPVNKYLEVIDGIAFPMRHRFYAGYWTMRATEGPKTAPYTYGTGIWKSYGSFAVGKTRLVLHTRDGTMTDVTPRLK